MYVGGILSGDYLTAEPGIYVFPIYIRHPARVTPLQGYTCI